MEPLGWDITKSAALYSEFSGVLAGFVFSAIGILMSTPPFRQNTKSISITLNWLVTAFISLVIVAFLFGLLAGEDRVNLATSTIRIRPFMEEVIAECLFAAAILQVMLSILWFFQEYAVHQSVMRTARMIFYGLLFIGAELIISAFGDLAFIKTHYDWAEDPSDLIRAALLFLLPCLLGGAIRWFRHRWFRWHSISTHYSLSFVSFSAILSNILSVLGAGLFGGIASIDDTQLAQIDVRTLILPGACLIGIFFWIYVLNLPSPMPSEIDQ